MFCKKCGKEVKEGTVFCGYCGAPVGQTTGPQQQSAFPPMGGGQSVAAAGTPAGKGGIGELLAKNKLLAIGVGAAVLVIIVLAVVLFRKPSGITGEWNGEYDFKNFWQAAGYVTEDVFRFHEDAGVDFSALPKVEGVLEFHKNGTWEFYLEKKSAMEGNKALIDDMRDNTDDEDAEEACEEYLEALNDELDDLLEVFVWSGDYEIDEEKGEIELTITKAGIGSISKKSNEAVLSYKIKSGKLTLKIEETDGDNRIYQLEELGLFDEKLSRE